MPGISGSQKAYKLALANVARAQTTRAAYFLRDVVPVTINGTKRTGVIQSSIRIDLNTGSEPHRCTFDFRGGYGVIPAAGQTVTICHGSTANRLFAGRILKADRQAARNADTRPVYQCEAAGWLFDLNQSRVIPGFTARSIAPYSLVPYLFSVTSPNVASLGFTASKIDPTLPYIEQFSTGPGEQIVDALDRIFRSVDAVYYMDQIGDVRAFGAINSLPAVPSTITSAASHVWNVRYSPTNFSRVFTRAHVAGAIQPTLADVDFGNQMLVPIASASIVSNLTGVNSDILAGTTEQWLLDGQMFVGSLIYRPEQAFEPGMIASTFLDTTLGSNTLVVAAKNVSSVRPFDYPRWYDVGGQIVYVSSLLGAYSLTVGSVAYAYAVPGSGPGALVSDIPTATEITGLYNAIATSVPVNRFVPAGSPFQTFVTRVNSTGVSYIASLTTSAQYGLISRNFEDRRLSPDGAVAVASTALQRGNPSDWASLEFTTRERAYEIGGPVFAAMNSPTESGGYSIAGTFTVQDMTIGGFGELTDTKGPTRAILAGAVRRPTMWQVLQGER